MAIINRIDAKPNIANAITGIAYSKKRVAAYARVSTEQDEQQSSYEAQVDYYTRYIQSNPEWEFVKVYSDEGISGTNTKKREGFNAMMQDALDGKIDLILTKSISRFARNTVDTLVSVRQLKEKNIEVYFEKENIHTLDAKGEMLITIMSSLAQEESRSISENVTWGKRKQMADGKIYLPYKSFLGYEKGEDGLPKIVEEEAKIVRLIYSMFIEGKTFRTIANYLTEHNYPTPSKRTTKWRITTIASILRNEKYKGDALLQKTFTTNFLEKTHKKNEGELPQYYIQDSHPAIIDPEIFDFVQSELRRREAMKEQLGNSAFSAKIICGDCGGFYGHKVWHSNSKSRNHVWFCNAKYKHDKPCGSPTLREDALKQAFLTAANSLLGDKTVYIEHLKKIIADIDNDDSLEEQLTTEETTYAEAVSELRTLIEINAHRSQDQQVYLEEFEKLDLRYKESEAKISQLKIAISERNARRHRLNMAIEKLYSISDILTGFDETTWNTLVESATVHKNGKITFLFRDGSKKTVVIPDTSTAKL